MTETATGTIIEGRYRVLYRLGSGGMADVYLAEDQQLGRKVAVKLLHRRFAEDPGFVERFRREAQAAAGLQHPNVVGVYDRGSFDDTYFIVMEYLAGRSLKQLIREEAPLDPVRAIDLTVQVLQAARFAHRRGVIHRDLKPHNVIVDDNGHAKVTDFGIARAGASDMTETGSIMGTAQYLSPEQAQGLAVSARSDLYSVGVVLYELLTGRVPFDAESAVTIALKHVSQTPLAPSRLNPNVPPELEQVVMWALNKNPEDRPEDADEFISALAQVKASIVAGRRGERTSSIAAVAVGGRPMAAMVPAALAPVEVPAEEPINGAPVSVPAGEAPPPHDAPRRRRPWAALLIVLLLAGAGVAAYLLTRPVKVLVPTVINEPLATASAQLQNAGLNVSTVTYPNAHRAGTVIRQSPEGGAKLSEGSTVTLTVSSGPGNATVPSVEGLTVAQARQVITRANLDTGRVTHQSSEQIPEGQVIGTDPAAGQTPPVGTSVTLIVSSGKPLIPVPDVTGESAAAAKADLQTDGFAVGGVTTQVSSSATAGDVLSQSPAGGTQATSGTTVDLVVAKAPPPPPPPPPAPITVPDVTGQTAAAAAATLTAAGFTVTQQTQTVIRKKRDGVVISQNPSGNATAKKGTAVTIVVGQYLGPTSTTTSSSTTSASTTSTPAPASSTTSPTTTT
ncbi:MAG: Stk1 family PASTA domain-containing Ser/Thr kinase [Solirubrobacterales bacterium]|nr:Stk1 family PASTA domain-containing Ser/Thr kinase [Solirubrobacterales bacterium]MBV9716521.1 Stk1 family PASTA domain-containing Ser/Thr kinase [Solirubrobacterales bacterium]